jgi:hypothetical protein
MDEITLYVYCKPDNREENKTFETFNQFEHHLLSKLCTFDPRVYHIINIHEDIPGIDHIGIISRISRLFSEKEIPILYVNTYSYNLVMVASEWMEKACTILGEIGLIL